MIRIYLSDLIKIVPEIIDLFLSGFIFIEFFLWFNNKKIDVSLLTLCSLIISYIIKAFFSILHSFLLVDQEFSEPLKTIIYLLFSIFLAIISTKILQSSHIDVSLRKLNHKVIHDDIFNEIIDYDKGTMMKIYLKNSDLYYIGAFAYREEKGLNSWLVLAKYICLYKADHKQYFDPEEQGLDSSVAINMQNIDRIELIYEKDSLVWKRMNEIV